MNRRSLRLPFFTAVFAGLVGGVVACAEPNTYEGGGRGGAGAHSPNQVPEGTSSSGGSTSSSTGGSDSGAPVGDAAGGG